ncbi:hypothetical protein GBAR_LOCUS4623, partial [Geodia barretti]
MFQIQFYTETFHSYTTLVLRDGAQFNSGAEGVYSCIIPDENGVEQVLHFGLYDYGFTSAFPPQPISVTYLSEDPFILSCDSAYLPPQLVTWEMNYDLISE